MTGKLWERIAIALLAVTMGLLAYMWTNVQAEMDRASDVRAALRVETSVNRSEIEGCKSRLMRIEDKIDRILERLK